MGSLDAVSWVGLEKVYSAFQTGNLVVLGLGVAGAPGPPVARATVSLVAFAVGAFVAGRLLRGQNDGQLWPRRVTEIEAAVSILLIGFLVYWVVVGADPSDSSAYALIGLGGLAAGLQTGAVFSLAIRAVFTTAATATVAAIMTDLAQERRAPRDLGRLVLVVAALVAGAAVGGALMVHAREIAPIVAPTLTLLVTMSAAIAFERPREAAFA
jgi:uncharacterized membrane protein YoaK (UPF0700 family)